MCATEMEVNRLSCQKTPLILLKLYKADYTTMAANQQIWSHPPEFRFFLDFPKRG